jgi:hypothetical protein
MCEPFLCPKVVKSSMSLFQNKNKDHGYIKGHIGALFSTFEQCSNVPLTKVFKSTPHETRNINFCYNKGGIITEDTPIPQDKGHIGI